MSHHFRYLIVGGGMTADAAVRGIREVDPDGSIGLIGAEPVPPYKRPPLSKGLWSGKPFDRIWLRTDELEIDQRLGRTVRWLEPRAKTVVDDRGTAYHYDKLLIATGSRPRRLPFGDDRIIYFRTVRDYERLRDVTESGRRIAVIGGGFIGSEIAAALAANGNDVTLIFPNDAIGGRIFPPDLGQSLNHLYAEHGVEVLTNHAVQDIEERDGRTTLRLKGPNDAERGIAVDGVVAGIGAEPNVDLARAGNLAVDNGILVDRFLRTSQPDIFAAGDVANFLVTALGERRRIEHEDNAKTMGRIAGRAMAGAPESYDHLPFFYSDFFDRGYEAVGDLDSSLETGANWTAPFEKGVISYLRDGRVRGVLLWNVWDRVEWARELIRNPDPAQPNAPKERLLSTR
jgi:3-phenylpropionate/trans-cinnamate dioxygenase ferredoxin reductase subunit